MNLIVSFSAAATQDLVDIWDYLAMSNDNSDVADEVVRAIRTRIKLLPKFPEQGSQCSSHQNVRRVFAGTYAIYYLIADGVVEIIRILHQRQHRERVLLNWLTDQDIKRP